MFTKRNWNQVERDAQDQTIKSGVDAVQFRFQRRKGGMYRLTQKFEDYRERLNETELHSGSPEEN